MHWFNWTCPLVSRASASASSYVSWPAETSSCRHSWYDATSATFSVTRFCKQRSWHATSDDQCSLCSGMFVVYALARSWGKNKCPRHTCSHSFLHTLRDLILHCFWSNLTFRFQSSKMDDRPDSFVQDSTDGVPPPPPPAMSGYGPPPLPPLMRMPMFPPRPMMPPPSAPGK